MSCCKKVSVHLAMEWSLLTFPSPTLMEMEREEEEVGGEERVLVMIFSKT